MASSGAQPYTSARGHPQVEVQWSVVVEGAEEETKQEEERG